MEPTTLVTTLVTVYHHDRDVETDWQEDGAAFLVNPAHVVSVEPVSDDAHGQARCLLRLTGSPAGILVAGSLDDLAGVLTR